MHGMRDLDDAVGASVETVGVSAYAQCLDTQSFADVLASVAAGVDAVERHRSYQTWLVVGRESSLMCLLGTID